MTPILRNLLSIFAVLFIGVPGAILAIYGGLLFVVSILQSFFAVDSNVPWWSLLAALGVGIAASIIGYAMIRGCRIIRDDPRERHAGLHFWEKAGWDLALFFIYLVLLASSGAILVAFDEGSWTLLVKGLVVFCSSCFGTHRIHRHRTRFRYRRLQHITEAETARAMLDFNPPSTKDRRT